MLIESLEHRRLLSASATVVGNGILLVQLDNSGDIVSVTEKAQDSSGFDIFGQSFMGTITNGVTVADVSGMPIGNGVLPGHFANIRAIVILGGCGSDTIAASTQNDPVFIDAGAGDDTVALVANPTDDSGNVHADYTGSGSIVLGGSGDDTIGLVGISNSIVLGGDGNDSITAGKDAVVSGSGTVLTGGDRLLIDGDNGDDLITSGFFTLTNSTLLGGAGNDTITDVGSNGSNVIDGGRGIDTITVSDGDIVLHSHGDIVTRVP